METEPHTSKQNFARAVRCTDEEIDLAAASLYAVSHEHPDLDVIAYRGKIAQLGMRVKSKLPLQFDDYEFVSTMHEVLFDEVGLAGSTKDYFNPKNSHLNELIESLHGNPVTMSILYMEVARSAGMEVDGVSLRRHFVVGIGSGEERLYVDPFHGGGLLSRKECLTMIVGKDRISDLDLDSLEKKLLAPVGRKAVLRRLLGNLKVAHEKHKNYELALEAAERVQLLEPSNLRNLSELAHLQTKVGHFGDAVNSLTKFLAQAPADANTEQAESALRKLKALTARESQDSSS